MKKSGRHQKIIGEFGEHLVCNWLSRSGFEVSIVDQVGIDVIAHNRSTNESLGISVKSRTREPGKEEESVNIFVAAKGDRAKLEKACEDFKCDPWIAVYVECSEEADLYLTSLRNYDAEYHDRDGQGNGWAMGKRSQERYATDAQIKHVKMKFSMPNWF